MRFKCILWGIAVLSATLLVATGAHAQNVEYYVLDGFGGVHAGGGAPVISPATPYFGFDVARDIMYAPGVTGQGYIVLDGFGGVHAGGPIGSISPGPPYFGFDIAQGITYRNIPPRAAGTSGANFGDITSSTAVTIASLTINAPDDGFLVVTGNTQLNCPDYTTAGDVAGRVWVNVDSTGLPATFSEHYAAIPCESLIAGSLFPTDSRTPHLVFSVSAGAHTVRLLAARTHGTKRFRWLDPHLSAVFVDQGSSGATVPEGAAAGANPHPSWQQ